MTRASLNVLKQVGGIAAQVDAKLPKSFTEEAQALFDLDEQARALERNTPHIDVPNTIADSLAGDDPAGVWDDPIVAEALRHSQVAEYAAGVNAAVGTRAAFFLATNADTILKAFKPPTAKAGDILATAMEKLGDPDDLTAVLSRGGDAAETWAGARKAEETIQKILSVRSYLVSVPGSGVRHVGRYQLLTLADPTPEEFVDAQPQLGNEMPRPWEIARRGWPFSLATNVELQTRTDRVLEAMQTADQRHAKAAQAASTRSLRFTP